MSKLLIVLTIFGERNYNISNFWNGCMRSSDLLPSVTSITGENKF